jgi:hypothetical protein
MKNGKNVGDRPFLEKGGRTEEAYSERLVTDYQELSQQLVIPMSVLIRWGKNEGKNSGWLSHHVTDEQYKMLQILKDHIWCNPFLLRIQLSQLTAAQREYVSRGAELSWVERVVLEDVLKRKVMKENRNLQFSWYQPWFQTRYPQGYQQLTSEILQKMVKRAADTIRYAQKVGRYQQLVESLGLELANGIAVKPQYHTKAVEDPKLRTDPSGQTDNKTKSGEVEGTKRPNDKSEDIENNEVKPQWPWSSPSEWAYQFYESTRKHKENLNRKLKELYEKNGEKERTLFPLKDVISFDIPPK